jgi:hypothetical protein
MRIDGTSGCGLDLATAAMTNSISSSESTCMELASRSSGAGLLALMAAPILRVPLVGEYHKNRDRTLTLLLGLVFLLICCE